MNFSTETALLCPETLNETCGHFTARRKVQGGETRAGEWGGGSWGEILIFSYRPPGCMCLPFLTGQWAECGLPWWLSGKEPLANAGDLGSIPGVRKISWKRKWPPTPVFLPGKSHGQKEPSGRPSMVSQKSWT